jgi:hypothetical protein
MKSHRARSMLLAGLAAGTIFNGQATMACGKGTVLFEDKTIANQTWNIGAYRELASADDGLIALVSPDQSFTLLNQAALFNDVEVCAKFVFTYPIGWQGWAGLVFWGVDEANNYSIGLMPADQGVGIYRGQNGRTLEPVPYFTSALIQKDQAAVNEMSVILSGNHAVVRINGTVVKEFDGYPPAGGGLVGLDFGSSADAAGDATLVVSEFQVRVREEPAKPPVANPS